MGEVVPGNIRSALRDSGSRGAANSIILPIFDQVVRNSSTIFASSHSSRAILLAQKALLLDLAFSTVYHTQEIQ